MIDDYSVIITDTSPLITLAKADELDVLLRLGVPIRIPDIVYLEAIGDGTHTDNARIIDWARDNEDLVRIAVTSRVEDWQILKAGGGKARDYGELAAIEVVTDQAARHPGEGMLLLYEDSDMEKFAVRAEVEMLTTGRFLDALEKDQAIQSKDHILDQATAAGRNVEKQRNQEASEQIVARIRATRERNRDRGPGFDR